MLEAILATLQRDETPAAAGASKPSYRWPAAWDFSAYMAHKGKDFVGRNWLFRDIDAWLAQPAPRALLIRADFGVGKSAIMAELVRRNPEGAIVGWHFCQHDTQDTLNPVTFVRSLAAQFATALPGYRTLVEADAALQDGLDRAGEDSASAFEAAIVAPLARIEPPNGARLLVIDALDEALELDAAAARRHGSIIRLLANKAGRLPDWLRLLVTSRNNPDVIRPLSTFGLKEIDAENIANQADLRDYALLRCLREPLAARLCETNRSAEEIADLLRDKSLGKFLYTIRALDDLENGNISPDDLAGLPPGMDGFYLDAFERRFARAGRNYDEARDLLGVLALAKEPLPLATLAEILGQPEAALQAVRRLLPDFIRLRGKLWAFDHFSLAEWLTGVGDDGFARAGDYAVDVAAAAERFHAWASDKIRQGKAHESAYLVRHLAAHLGDTNERRDVFRKLMLTSYDWLAERLRLAGADALIADCAHLGDAPEAPSLRALFCSSAHVLRRHTDQLPAQLLGRIRSLGKADNPLAELLAATKTWLDRRPTDPNHPILLPTTGSLRISASQIARFEGHTDSVSTLVALADGRLASGSDDGTVRLWDPEGMGEPRVFEGHTGGVKSLVALADGRLASGSDDNTVRLWEPAGVREPRILVGHTSLVTSLVALADGRLASASFDGTVRLWDPDGVGEPRVLEGHTNWVTSLVSLADGRLASGSDDGTVRLWDPEGVREPRVLEGHTREVTSLVALADGRLASGSVDGTVRLWDPDGVREPRVLEGHTNWVTSLVSLADGRLASASWDGTVRLWDPEGVREPRVLEGHRFWVTSLVALADGRLASASDDNTVRLWDPEGVHEPRVLGGHTRQVTSLVALADGRLASGSVDGTARLWDPDGVREPRVLEGHRFWVTSLVALADGRIASASGDGTVRLWDPEGMGEPRILKRHTREVTSLVALADGRLASGSDDGTVRLWDPEGVHEPRVLEGHTGRVTSLVALADARLASGSADNTVRLWDLEGVREPRVLEGHMNSVTSLVALADGRLASASKDGAVRLWDTRFGRQIALFVADAAISALAAAGADTLAAGDATGAVHFLKLDP
ncbi:MAG: hypothetical protein IPH26_12765 [Sterolibacteriaceae bacterium]|uniref:Uncharacterized protein n=1 Tax=Candidatus Methylophosphatis roskildensis TaxID=2899263 RepID=A0A9D7E400_9PROT|nr:hypothetical protein [Candidatus Methylophosphatis roskildensis]MBK7236026.1 hypothetical protein [Sterolibacteriaceae bacterium]